jgi:hypothetical protein
VKPLGIYDELRPIRQAIEEFKPDIVFNLLEEFASNTLMGYNVAGFLELMGVPYTGCNPRGLILTGEKSLAKKVLIYHRIRLPAFHVAPVGRKVRRPRALGFPLIVKSLTEHASLGISQASLVSDDAELSPINPYAATTSHDGKEWSHVDRVRPWDSLSDDEKRLFARMAEVYAGFLSHADHELGRLLDFLEESDQLDNTFVVLVSDNGSSGEGGPNGSVNENKFFNGVEDTIEVNLHPAVGEIDFRFGMTPWGARPVGADPAAYHQRVKQMLEGLENGRWKRRS